MDLGISDSTIAYDVATVSFFNTIIKNESESYVSNKNRFREYKIYISSERDYLNSNSSYKFRLIGSESDTENAENTIYYELYLKPTGTDPVKLDECTDYSNSSSYSTYKSSATKYYSSIYLGGVSRLANTTTYVLYPYYSYAKISSGNDYQLTWKGDAVLWIKLTEVSLQAAMEHNYGMYTSKLYFTVESP